MANHENYMLKVTAGPTYDVSTHEDVHVNTDKPVTISSEHVDAEIRIRIKDYRGLPPSSPSTSPYFSHPTHPYDRYSLHFSFLPKTPIPGHNLVFGNDFDHPIRDRLPALFDKAFSIVKWWIDPGLEGDVMADEPYLYGAVLSSVNVLNIGVKDGELDGKGDGGGDSGNGEGEGEVVVLEEGAEGDGEEVRKELGIPDSARQRQKHFLNENNRKGFEFEKGRVYKADFFNPYLDFNEFALKLGYGLPPISILSHWDGQPLRYVLKNTLTNTPLFVINLQLIPTPEAQKAGEAESAEEMFGSVHKDDTPAASKRNGKEEKDGEGKGKGSGNGMPGRFGGEDDELD